MDEHVSRRSTRNRVIKRPTIGLNAHLFSRSLSYRSAGVSRYIEGLLAYLPQVDGSFSYVAYTGERDLHMPGWRIRPSAWRTHWPPARILWEQMAQPWAVWRDGVDLLHAPVYVGPLVARCPVVITIHDLSFYHFPTLFPRGNRIYLQRFTRLAASRAARIIVDSQSTCEDVYEILGVSRSRIEVIYPGVDAAMHPVKDPSLLADFRKRYGLPDRFILFLGTLEPRKNLAFLLEAFACLVQYDAVPHDLVIAGGKGWFYETLEARVQALGLKDRVHFPGYVPDETLPLWYSAADLFVYPSLYEGFGLPPLEAMACGTPVIVSDRSSLPEAVGEAGIRIPLENPEAWAQTMAELLSAPDRLEALSRAGLQWAQRFTWQATAEATAKLYRKVLYEQA